MFVSNLGWSLSLCIYDQQMIPPFSFNKIMKEHSNIFGYLSRSLETVVYEACILSLFFLFSFLKIEFSVG